MLCGMLRLCSLLFVAAMASACTSTPTGAECPTDNAPTYDHFGRQFISTYCIGCHSATASDRHGAPTTQNYDSEADIKQHATDIDLEAAAGPDATNSSMPDMSGPVHAAPSDEDRKLLGQFLACEQR